MIEKKIHTPLVDLSDCPIEDVSSCVVSEAKASPFGYLVTPNVDHMMRINKDPELQSIYNQASICTCDSRILYMMLRLKKYPIENVVTGSSLTESLFETYLDDSLSILIFGCEDKVFLRLQETYPRLSLHHINPSMGFIHKPEEVESLIEGIAGLAPDLIVLSVGSPQQERFAKKLEESGKLTSGIALCVGASIKLLIGDEKRAPAWIQQVGMEWLYRLLQDPNRLWKRYYANLKAIKSIYGSL